MSVALCKILELPAQSLRKLHASLPKAVWMLSDGRELVEWPDGLGDERARLVFLNS